MPSELIIPYNSKPDYDDWGSDSFWNLSTWVGWHKGLVKKYGKEKDNKGYPIADKIWLDAWTKQSFGASPTLAILQPTRFKTESDYIKKNPLLYEYTGLKRAMEGINPLEISYKGVGAVEDAVGGVTDVTEGISNALKVLKYALPIGLILIFVGGSAFIYKRYIKTA